MIKIAVAGGGTAGHLYPALALIEVFQRYHEIQVVYFVVKGKIDEKVVPKEHPSFRIVPIETRGLIRPIWSFKNFKRFLSYTKEIIKIEKVLKKFKPDFVFSTGSYAGGLLALAAKKKYPLFIHEQNVKPGIANLKTAKYARKIFVSFDITELEFPETFRRKVVVTGNPTRDYTNIRKYVGEIPDGVTLVFGGSLGSEFINSLMMRVYEMDKDTVYVHATGNKNWTLKLNRYRNVIAYDYIDFMPILWRKAKFVIARAGATTVAEMLRYKVPGILIPWEGSAESHQLLNALQAEEVGLAMVLRENELTPRLVYENVRGSVYNYRLPSENPAFRVYKCIMEEIS